MGDFLHLELFVELIEDLHSGTGTGGGGIDSIQTRDRDGRPAIRATHLKGLLRDAGYTREWLCEAGERDSLIELFGTEGGSPAGKLVLTSLRMAKGTKGREQFRLWAGTGRDRGSRSPREDTLRLREHIAAGTCLTAELELRDASLLRLLERCLQRLTHLGSRRGRGTGRVRIGWKQVQEKCEALPRGPDETRLRLVLRNLEPLQLARTGFAGNVIPGETFIRGQRLLGALASWAMDAGVDPGMLLSEREITVGDAVPLPADASLDEKADISGWEICPMSLELGKEKPAPPDGVDWPWWAEASITAEKLGNRAEVQRRDEKLKRPTDKDFLFSDDGGRTWRHFEVPLPVHLRNRVGSRLRVDDIRPGNDDGDLFSATEIREETLFLADLGMKDEATAHAFAETFAPLLQQSSWLTIGRGGRPVLVERHRWLKPRAHDEAADEFAFMLESDLIARAPDLGFHDRLGGSMLCELAGMAPVDFGNERVSGDMVEIRGFNAETGLPRAPVLAIRRGSCIRLEGPGCDALRSRLATIGALGERTREGFGRFRLDGAVPTKASPATGDAKKHDPALGTSETLLQLVKGWVDQVWKKNNEIDDIRRTQWQDLRVGVRNLADGGAAAGFIDDWLKRIERHGKRPALRLALESARDHVRRLDVEIARTVIDFFVRDILARGRAAGGGGEAT